ncbi:hypothetical protein FB45DRAFT_365931 [Roridomyces roridus]|uniref:Uncharacterized protein n=1 Tax=Roridomyces roridus TaxID=1738132 RepID=A0AAD7C8V6_9AGAR|nr:hypothetical protein FB45DRAFT_365931 [Roridomyces roridus]
MGVRINNPQCDPVPLPSYTMDPPTDKKCNKEWCNRRTPLDQRNCDECRRINREAQRRSRQKGKTPTGTANGSGSNPSRKRKSRDGDADDRPSARQRTEGVAEQEVQSDDDMRGYEEDDTSDEVRTAKGILSQVVDMDIGCRTLCGCGQLLRCLEGRPECREGCRFQGRLPCPCRPLGFPARARRDGGKGDLAAEWLPIYREGPS